MITGGIRIVRRCNEIVTQRLPHILVYDSVAVIEN